MKRNIILANKLNKKDSATGLDVWYTYLLTDCEYTVELVTDMSGQSVMAGNVFRVLIPFSERYKSYDEWKKLPEKENFYTISSGDVIFLTDSLEEDVTANNIQKLKALYQNNVVDIRSIKEVSYNGISKYQFEIRGV